MLVIPLLEFLEMFIGYSDCPTDFDSPNFPGINHLIDLRLADIVSLGYFQDGKIFSVH